MSIYDYKVKDADGNQVSLKEYEGKVMLIIAISSGTLQNFLWTRRVR